MKIYSECKSCLTRQATEAAEMATEDPQLREEIIREAGKIIADLPFESTPPYMDYLLHRTINQLLGDIDPYKSIKSYYNLKALEYFPTMKRIVREAGDPFQTSVKIAIAGNTIDFGANSSREEIDIPRLVQETIEAPLLIDELLQFRKNLEKAKNILYLADNAGEIVFDRILIEEISDYGNRVCLAVKSGPIVNDAITDDAIEAGLYGAVPVIETGVRAPGTILELCDERFLKKLKQADLIIAKGQANYETLSEKPYPVFFLLRAKCSVIARHLDVPVGATVVKDNLRTPAAARD
jgi:uncharacterized protein with ATP-grasp and redox domains